MFGVGLAAVVGDMWDYNRDIFKYDQNQRLKRDMAALNMRIKQFELYREDVRDLVELTVGRMDIYHMVGAMLLQFIVVLYAEGRVEFEEEGTLAPHWFMEIYYLSLGCAFIFLLMSIWLAMHASVAAQSFGTRMLTRFVRLPIPNAEVLNKARTKLGQYERGGVRNIFRIPFLSKPQTWRGDADNQPMKEIPAVPDDPQSDLPYQVGELPQLSDELIDGHIQLYRKLQGRWQSFDAYSRVSMALGFNQVIQAICTFIIMHMCLEQKAPLGAFMSCLPLQFVSLVLLNLDIKDAQAWEFYMALAGSFGAPFANLLAVIFYHEAKQFPVLMDISVIVCLFCHAAWLIVVRRFAKPEMIEGVYLPFRFRSVLYLDVFADTVGEKATKTQSAMDRQQVITHLRKVIDEAAIGTHAPFPTMNSLKAGAEACMEHVSDIENDEEIQRVVLQASVCFEEQRLRSEELNVRRAFRRWKSPPVQSHLSEYNKTHIRSLEQQFDAALEELVNSSTQPEMRDRGGASLMSTGSCVLLEFEYDTGYDTTPYYYNRATDEVVWEVDEGVQDRKRESLETLTAKVQKYREAVDEYMHLQHMLNNDDVSIMSQSTLVNPSTWTTLPEKLDHQRLMDAAGNPVNAQDTLPNSSTLQKLTRREFAEQTNSSRELRPIIAEHDDNIHFSGYQGVDKGLNNATSFVPGAADACRRTSRKRRNSKMSAMRNTISFIGEKAFETDTETTSPERLPWGCVLGALNSFCIMWIIAGILGVMDVVIPHSWWPWHGSPGTDIPNHPHHHLTVEYDYPTPYFEPRSLHCSHSVVCENRFGLSWERTHASWNVVNTTFLDHRDLYMTDHIYRLSGTPQAPVAASATMAAAFDGKKRVVVYRLDDSTKVVYGVKVDGEPISVDISMGELVILHQNLTVIRYTVGQGKYIGGVKVRKDTMAACRTNKALLLATSKAIQRVAI